MRKYRTRNSCLAISEAPWHHNESSTCCTYQTCLAPNGNNWTVFYNYFVIILGLPLWIVNCISVCIMIHHEKIWRLFKHFFHGCISLHIMINYKVPGYIMKDPDGYWNRFDLSWCIMINCDISQSPMEKSFRVLRRITICHYLHYNISERFPLTKAP